MAIRQWAVRPGEDGVVDRNELIAAIMDGEALLHRAGGVLTVLVERVTTDIPNERLTSLAIIQWKDRVDAKPQPERAPEPVTAVPAPGDLAALLPAEEPAAEAVPAATT